MSFQCPDCKQVSWNIHDENQRYCPACKKWFSPTETKKEQVMKPTVGRIVHYHDQVSEGVEPIPQAAMVTFCMGHTVNLVLYQRWEGDRKGFIAGVIFSETPKEGHWSWPPRVG